MSKEIKFNEKDRAIVEVLKNATKPMTNKEISAALGTPVAAGTLTSCVNKGIIAVAGKVEVSSSAPREVNTYAFVTDEKLKTGAVILNPEVEDPDDIALQMELDDYDDNGDPKSFDA